MERHLSKENNAAESGTEDKGLGAKEQALQEAQSIPPQKSIKVNVIMNAILAVASVIFPLISFPYVSRILDTDGIGSVSFAQSFISYFIMLSTLGIPIYGIRACAKVRDDKEKLSHTVQELMIINLVLTAFAYICLIAPVLLVETLNRQRHVILVVSVSIFLSSISISWLYSALEEYAYITVRTIIVNIISLICIFIFIKEKGDNAIYALISVMASAGSGILNLIHARKFVSFKKKAKYDFRRHFKPIIFLFFMTATISIYTNLDKVMLGFMINDNNASVGVYDVSVKVYRVLIGLITALGTVLLPRMSYYFQQNKTEEIKKLIEKGVNLVFILSLPMVIFFLFYAKDVIILFCGESFSDAVLPFQILLPAILFVGLSNITGMQILVAMDREKVVTLTTLIGAVINLAINLVLIPYLGVIATALSTIITEFVILAVQIVILRQYIPLLIKGVKVKKLLTMAIALSAATYAFTFVSLPYNLQFLLAGAVCLAIFLGVLLLFKEPVLIDLLQTIFRKGKTNGKRSESK